MPPQAPLGAPPTAPGRTLRDVLRQEAQQLDIPPDLALAIVQQESGGRQRAVSPKGARGFFQLMPATARELGVDPDDPIQNIQGGLRYFKQQLDRYNGDVRLALAAYNAGPNAITGGRVPDIPETQQYVQRVFARWQQGGTGTVVPPPPAVEVGTPPPEVPAEEATPTEAGFFSGFDPRTRQGRRNLAGTAAGVAAGALTGAPGGPPGMIAGGLRGGLLRALPIIAAAGAGGALAETGEQVLRGEPTRLGGIAAAGAEQGALEALGGVIAWPVKALGRRVLAPSVVRAAGERLTAARESLSGALRASLDLAERGVRRIEQAIAQLPSGSSASQAGELTRSVLRGPAQTARTRAGEALDAIAQTGPDLDITSLKQQAQAIFDREIQRVAAAFSGKADAAASPEAQGILKNLFGRRAPTAEERAALVARLVDAGVETSVAEATVDTAMHPAMGVLRQILSAPDTVPFQALHQLRKEFDQKVTFTSTATTTVKQITKGLAGGMRQLLNEYEPFRDAAVAYQRIVPLYERGIAPQLRRQIVDNPEEVIDLIRPGEPTRVANLRDLLVQQSARGGGAAEGKAAWNAVRAAWTRENLIDKGIEKLSTNLQRIGRRPEFLDAMYGDAEGRVLLQRLREISTAFDEAQGVFAAVRGAPRLLRPPTEVEKRFVRFVRGTRPLDEEAADIIRATFLGPGSIWGGLSMIRLLRGPALNDLVQWSAYSPVRTQLLVQATTSPAGGMAFATLLRAAFTEGVADWAGEIAEPPARADAGGLTPPPAIRLTPENRAAAQAELAGAPPP